MWFPKKLILKRLINNYYNNFFKLIGERAKMKKKIKKDLFIIIALLVILSAIILPKELNDLDEMWNYNSARNIADGKLPYKDFSIIIPPFFPNLCAIFLSLFGNEIIVMRFLAVILCTGILYMTYKVLEKMAVNTQINCILVISLMYLFKEHFRVDYNFLVLFNILAIMYLELRKKQNPILLGVLARNMYMYKANNRNFSFSSTSRI